MEKNFRIPIFKMSMQNSTAILIHGCGDLGRACQGVGQGTGMNEEG
jgi:hypothetical protein